MFTIPFTAGSLKASLWANAALALLLISAVTVQQFRVQAAHVARAHAETKTAEAKRALALRNVAIAEEREAFERKARETEQKHAQAFAAADAAHLKELSDAKATAARTVADLRAGNLELRQHWQGCLTRASVPGAAPDPGQPDAGAELRATSAGRIVHAGAECDAQVRGLQRLLTELTRR